MSVFDQVFKIVIGEEGGLSTNPADPGNWTSGVCGRGMCRGTKYGIAASAHPGLDIQALTIEQARAIYQTLYWDPSNADALPPRLALLVFDASVNCGLERSVRWLQSSVGCVPDGIMGAATLTAALQATTTDSSLVCANVLALRLQWMTSLPTWRVFGLGWARRICGLPFQSLVQGGP